MILCLPVPRRRRIWRAPLTSLCKRSGIVDGLVEVGLVENRGRRTGLIGQSSVMFAPDPDGAIGLHVGRRALDAVLVDFTGAVRRLVSSESDYPEPCSVERLATSQVDGVAEA
jgi:hypothetical protein